MYMRYLGKINEFVFMIGGYFMLFGWWFTQPNTLAFGVGIATTSVLIGLVAAFIIILYSSIKGKTNE